MLTPFLEDIRTKTDFSGSVASLIDVKKDGFFSGTVSTKFESDKRYSFSTKFSYAKAEVIKKQRRYLLNTDINSLSKYLTPSFLSDIQKYSADKIVLKYGTHVLTNFTVGGKYTGLYKSAIVEENNHTEKTKTVSAGAKLTFRALDLTPMDHGVQLAYKKAILKTPIGNFPSNHTVAPHQVHQ